MILEVCEAAEELVRSLEDSAADERKRKRRRALALALGLIGNGRDVAKAAATALPKRHPRKLARKVEVAAFRTIGPRGAMRDPEPIVEGDTLYISPVDRPGTGEITKDSSRIPFGVARAAVAAGARQTISVTLYEKLWLTSGDPCDVCDENSIEGWIPMDEPFSSGDWEPLAHPNCRCSLETRRVD